ncbi:Uncharacterised protein [Raoultella terrigena]|uniref:Uncharacterized protein n=1 Tax=Raoultella terrigena TaxID=577 RepID=A0A4U9CV66_RAOTE|nr:Uncharacterised protein [Raoultella terrigena]
MIVALSAFDDSPLRLGEGLKRTWRNKPRQFWV